MQAGSAIRIEAIVDRAASALLAMAAAFAAWTFIGNALAGPQRMAAAAAAAALAYAAAVRVLRAVQPEPPRLPVPVFDVREIEPVEMDELLLTDAYVPAAAEEPLVLDDVLAELEPDSRVVRLFDPAAMPTAGELDRRIQRHLVRGAPPAPPHDASQALHDALAELRKSLR
jgi:hypothetical protein